MKEYWLDKLARKYGKYSIHNLMSYIVGGMAIVYLMDLIVSPMTHISLTSALAFDLSAIMQGQIWRLFTFMFIPPDSSLLFILFSLYFYWLIGNSLENEWGAFRFNVFYFCGVIGTIIAGVITGYTTNNYLNLSLFLAFALMYPNYQVMVFFFLPVKMKYLAFIDAVGLMYMLITDSWSGKIALLVAMANVILFFWRDLIRTIKDAKRRHDFKKNAGNYWR